MQRTRIQRIQDCVHGLMEFSDMETSVVEVLRTPEVQRLRRIRQMGLAYFVFPGAEHSRFAHSLGAAFLALRFGRHLAEVGRDLITHLLLPGPEAIRDFAVAALCHDMGHGPLSHVWEREIVGPDYNVDSWVAKLGLTPEKDMLSGAKWHEVVAYGLLAWEDGELHRILESQEAGSSKRLRYFLRGKYFSPYLPRLISSDIDVDRADYLLRDAYQTGASYGRYDLDWLVSSCTVGSTAQRELVVGFDRRRAVRAIEEFLVARRAMYETVYYHRTVRCAEAMLTLFLRRLRNTSRNNDVLKLGEFLDPLLRMIAGEVVDQRDLLRLDDFALWALIETVANVKQVDDIARDLAMRILSRDFFRTVPCASQKVSAFLRKRDSYDKMLDAIRPFCQGDPNYYLFVDEASCAMLCERPEELAYLIEDGQAVAIRDYHEFASYRTATVEFVRVFTLPEAIDAVQKLIR